MFKKWNHRIAADGNHPQGGGLTPTKLGKLLAWKNPLIIGILHRLAGKVNLRAAAGTCRNIKKRHGNLA
jgi:energy-converting hydrogenase Eha subunit B